MEAEMGEQDIYPRAGMHAECAEWMHNRQVSVYGGDCIEKLPYPSESFTSAIHMIVLASMGLPILDWPSLTELARTCERLSAGSFSSRRRRCGCRAGPPRRSTRCVSSKRIEV